MDVIATDRAFDEAQTTTLGSLAELMIPAEGDLPSAADAAIFAEVLEWLSERPELVNAGLALLADALPPGGTFSTLPPAERLAAVSRLRAECPTFVALFEAATAACYYRDVRVLRSLGLPARAPYPEGNAVDPTDWSLLHAVRERQPFYRSI